MDKLPIERLLDLIAQLPAGLRADWNGTNHYELTTSDQSLPWWWLSLNEYTLEDFDSDSEVGQRVGLLLDLAEAAKAAEQYLRKLPPLSQEPLLPCPFCGGNYLPDHPKMMGKTPFHSMPKLEETEDGWRVTCYGCGVGQWESGFTKGQAIQAWNTRKPPHSEET